MFLNSNISFHKAFKYLKNSNLKLKGRLLTKRPLMDIMGISKKNKKSYIFRFNQCNTRAAENIEGYRRHV